MPSKTLMQLCNEITFITENIKEHYPELHRYLETSLISPTVELEQNNAKRKDYQDYLNNLKEILQQQMQQLQPTNQPLTNLAGKLNYNPIKFEKAVLQEQNGQKVILFAFAKEQELKTHTAPHDVILVMLEGLCTFTLDFQKPQILHSGQVIRIPGKVKHSLKALSDFKMLLYI